jgi:hypothetical protein
MSSTPRGKRRNKLLTDASTANEDDERLIVGVTLTDASRGVSTEGDTQNASGASSKPNWNKSTLELCYQGQLARKIRRIARNPIIVLDAFQEDGWPAHIDNPLPPNANISEVVRTLNQRLKLLRFASDGASSGFNWRLL